MYCVGCYAMLNTKWLYYCYRMIKLLQKNFYLFVHKVYDSFELHSLSNFQKLFQQTFNSKGVIFIKVEI